MQIKQATKTVLMDWLMLRKALWPSTCDQSHQVQINTILNQLNKMVCFIAWDKEAVGLVEATLRYDYVAGCSTSPVVFLEGIYVIPSRRKQGIARLLCLAVETWGKSKGCTELASDVAIDSLVSQRMHQALAFKEIERVVCYYKKIS